MKVKNDLYGKASRYNETSLYSEHICQSLGPSIYRASTVSRFKASEMNIVFDILKHFARLSGDIRSLGQS